MKRLLYLLVACIFAVACCSVQTQTSNSGSTTRAVTPSIIEDVQVSSIRIDVKGTSFFFLQFEWEGHVYICSSRNDIILHSPSCSCHDSNQLFNSGLQTSGLSLFDNY